LILVAFWIHIFINLSCNLQKQKLKKEVYVNSEKGGLRRKNRHNIHSRKRSKKLCKPIFKVLLHCVVVQIWSYKFDVHHLQHLTNHINLIYTLQFCSRFFPKPHWIEPNISLVCKQLFCCQNLYCLSIWFEYPMLLYLQIVLLYHSDWRIVTFLMDTIL
jgi:hypothetical protein